MDGGVMTRKEIKYSPKRPTPIWAKDKRVCIERYVSTGVDDHGQEEGSWQPAPNGDVWANIVPLSASTVEYAHQLYAQATHRIFIDYRSDITQKYRIRYGTRYFDIGWVRNVNEDNITLELFCSEGPL